MRRAPQAANGFETLRDELRGSGSATDSQSRERLARAKASRGCVERRRNDCDAGVAARVNAGIGILEVSDDPNPRGSLHLGCLPLRRSRWQAHDSARGCDASY